MSVNVNATAVVTYQNNMELALQQNAPKITNSMLKEFDAAGEKVDLDDIIGAVPDQEATDRHGDTKLGDTGHDRVWLTKPFKRYYADMVDREDKVAAKIDIEGAYTMAGSATISRAWDDQTLRGLYGNIISGKDGTVTTAFPAGMTVPVTTGQASGNARMNVDKFRMARKYLAQNYNDMQEERFIVLCAEQVDDLLKEVPVTSDDFKQLGGRVDPATGRLLAFLGFTVIEMELANPLLKYTSTLSLDVSGFRKNPFWVKSGLARGVWVKLFTSIDPIPMKRYSRLIYAETIVAATRVQAGKVGIILNSEA